MCTTHSPESYCFNYVIIHIRKASTHTAKQVVQAPEDKKAVQTFLAKKEQPKKKNVTKQNDGKDDRKKTSIEKTKCQKEVPKSSDVTADEYQTRFVIIYVVLWK